MTMVRKQQLRKHLVMLMLRCLHEFCTSALQSRYIGFKPNRFTVLNMKKRRQCCFRLDLHFNFYYKAALQCLFVLMDVWPRGKQWRKWTGEDFLVKEREVWKLFPPLKKTFISLLQVYILQFISLFSEWQNINSHLLVIKSEWQK